MDLVDQLKAMDVETIEIPIADLITLLEESEHLVKMVEALQEDLEFVMGILQK